MSKRKLPQSPHGASNASASTPVDTLRLLPRIQSYLDQLDPSLPSITPASIVAHLRATYPEYKLAKGFAKTVEQLCEKMRQQAMSEGGAGETEAAGATTAAPMDTSPSSSSAAVDGITIATSTSLTGTGASSPGEEVVILSSHVTPTNAVATAGAASTDAPSGTKRRKLDHANAITVNSSASSAAEESDEESEEETNDVIDVELTEVEDANLVNSTMRNLYNRSTSTTSAANSTDGTTDAHTPYQANPQKPRQPKSKEKIIYTTNSKKPMSAKKKAQKLAAVSNVHFKQSSGGPDDMAGGGGDGSNWHPEVLHPTLKYEDLGGIEGILQEIHELVEYPLTHPEIYRHLGIQPPRGVLLHGPPGCGKTMLAHAIAGSLGVPFMKISAPEVVSGMSGESEQKIRTLFADALENAPCLLFIDEIDAITPKRATAQREMERRIVAQLLTCMDSLSTTSSGDPSKIVIVIGATNRPDSLDAALRRAGRFDREIAIGIPDEAARARILQVMCQNMKLEPGIDWKTIAKAAVGYVGADLMALTREAAVIAINRIFRSVLPTPSLGPMKDNTAPLPPSFSLLSNTATTSPKVGALMPPTAGAIVSSAVMELKESLNAAAAAAAAATAATSTNSTSPPPQSAHLITDSRSSIAQAELHSRNRATEKLRAQVTPLTDAQLAPLFISYHDFQLALKKVQPSSKREGFATIPDVTWQTIGGLDELREELSMTILQPILNPQQFEAIGLTVPAGVLLFGPPGCGKTLIAKAIANESGASFLSIKGPELLNQYVGQSERAVRKVFQRARASAPCVIFFDELDALVPKRGSSTSEGNNVSERVVNQLLTEMDGLEERRSIFVIAATNRPDIIDPAMLRPGRLDKLLYVKLPSASERAAILVKHTVRTPLSKEVDLNAIAADPRAEGFSGADVAALVREATLHALREAQAKQRQEMIARGAKPHELNTWASMKATPSSSSAPPAVAAAAASSSAPLPILVCTSHFHFAFSKVFPSVSPASRARYDRMHKALSRARSTMSTENPGSDNAKGAEAGTALAMIEEEEKLETNRMNTNSPTIGATHQRISSSPTLNQSALMPPPPPKSFASPRTMQPQTTILSSMNAFATKPNPSNARDTH